MTSTMKINARGVKEWFNSKGQKHREDGPASIWPDGDYFWYKNGLLHRLIGPATNFPNDKLHWWIDGKELRQEEHPFNIFRTEYNLSENYEKWSIEMKILFKMIYG
jgi:hypothetical protein